MGRVGGWSFKGSEHLDGCKWKRMDFLLYWSGEKG